MPLDGLIPAIPQKPAGVLNDPAKSEPVASGTIPDATAAAPPPVDAPALKSGLNGLPVLPCNGLVVVAPNPCSGTLVFPKIIAENLLKLLTTSSSSSATLSLKSGDPYDVFKPFTSFKSFMPIGNGRLVVPFVFLLESLSSVSQIFIASSKFVSTIAFME